MEDYKDRIKSLMEELVERLKRREQYLTAEEFQLYKALQPIEEGKEVFENIFHSVGISLYLQQIFISEYESQMYQSRMSIERHSDNSKSNSDGNLADKTYPDIPF
jgi:hypothetical protein